VRTRSVKPHPPTPLSEAERGANGFPPPPRFGEGAGGRGLTLRVGPPRERLLRNSVHPARGASGPPWGQCQHDREQGQADGRRRDRWALLVRVGPAVGPRRQDVPQRVALDVVPALARLAVPDVELLVGGRRQTGVGPPAIELGPRGRVVFVQADRLPGVWRVGRLGPRPDQLPVTGDGGRDGAHPQLDGLPLHLRVRVAQEAEQVGAGLVVDLIEPPKLGGPVGRLPVFPMPIRPLADSPGLALDLPRDGLPGMAGRPQLGGNGNQGR
jgi:hypothetical protein